ncbi:hypothetical protein KNN17_03660, partial [Arthrobacter bambusae]|nr:hypothetical protein [Arthrobacter bambusae]
EFRSQHNPIVLGDRPVVEGTDVSRLSRYEDDVWDLTPGILDHHSTTLVYRFDVFPENYREFAKQYVWTLINHDAPVMIHTSGTPRLSLQSICTSRAALNRVLTWFDTVGITDLRSVRESDYDRLLAWLLTSNLKRDVAGDVLLAVRRLWSYRELLDPPFQLPPSVPWYGATNQDLLGRSKTGPENRTPRIADATIQPLVVWAARFVTDFASDIIAAYREWRLYSHGANAQPRGPLPVTGSRQERVVQALEALRNAGRGLPSTTVNGTPAINWAHLGRLAQARGHSIELRDKPLIQRSGLKLDHSTYVLAKSDCQIEGVKWKPNGVEYHEAPLLAENLMTAAFILVSYLSGMRPGEALNLRRGCVEYSENTELWLVTGRHFKGVRDLSGVLDPAGAIRQQPWTVHELVAEAIQVLEQLHDEPLLFSRNVMHKSRPDIARAGSAITTAQVTAAIGRFAAWVNRFCKTRGRLDIIPADSRGTINPSRFRRTLAWHIVRRPRGLVAAAIQYGHVWVQMTQGYAGSLQSGFADEIAFERWLTRMDEFKAAEEYLDSGGRLSGPAASAFESRTRAANHRFAGRTVATLRQAQRLLDDASMQIFAGRGMHCVFDKSKSLCARGQKHPSLTKCQEGCQNLVRTDADVDELREDLRNIKEIRAMDDLAPPVRWARLDAVSEQLQTAIAAHEGMLA